MNINKLIELLYLPITNENIITKLKELKIPQPVIDDSYYEDNEIEVSDEEDKIFFTFEEITNSKHNNSGIPILSNITLAYDLNVTGFYNINEEDNYTSIVEYIGKEADYVLKVLPNMRLWILSYNNLFNYTLSIYFEKKKLQKVQSIVLSILEEDDPMEGFLLL